MYHPINQCKIFTQGSNYLTSDKLCEGSNVRQGGKKEEDHQQGGWIQLRTGVMGAQLKDQVRD